MKTKPLGNGERDTISSEIFVPGSIEKHAMILGAGYFDPTDFNKEAMEKAFKELFRRNDVFRMKIVGKGLFKRQYIGEYYDPVIECHELKGGHDDF